MTAYVLRARNSNNLCLNCVRVSGVGTVSGIYFSVAGVSLAVLPVVLWLVWRPILAGMFLPAQEVEEEARIMVQRHGNRAITIVRELEINAWTQADYAGQTRWRKVEKAVARLSQ